jgi:hypothetical protein
VGGAAWDVEASAPCAEHCDITQPSSHITSTSGARSGADPGRPLDWPHPGGESSSAAAPAAPWSPVGQLYERVCPHPWGGARGTDVCDAAATSSCCGLGLGHRHPKSLVVALAAVRGALSERRLVVAGIPNLSSLAGARVGTVDITLSAKKRKSERQPLEIEGARGEMLLTSNWRIPASSSLRAGGYLRRARWHLRGACWRLH